MHGPSGSDIGIASILLSIIAIGLAVVGIASAGGGGSSSPSIPLGTWNNMPSAVTELMGNASYRGLVIALKSSGSIGGLLVGLTVTCVNPSNTAGANLQLQYANYSDTTHSNSSNFVNIGISQLIDNSANNHCPG